MTYYNTYDNIQLVQINNNQICIKTALNIIVKNILRINISDVWDVLHKSRQGPVKRLRFDLQRSRFGKAKGETRLPSYDWSCRRNCASAIFFASA